jgi:SAM-dependent methyltransferase/diadenosine tetraphosphate (Ap4A) HIT family hydrolase
MTTDTSKESCDLCMEIRNDATWATGGFPRTQNVASYPFSRLIRKHNGSLTFAGLGSLAPGYTLLVPDCHVRSVGELPLREVRELYQTAWQIARLVQQEFDCTPVVIEHGSSGASHDPSGAACITHAHIHIFPLDRGVLPDQFVPPGSERVSNIDQLRKAAAQGRNYYYCTWAPGIGYLRLDADLGHQHARRVWARMLGKADEWDWAATPYFSNTRLTARRLRNWASADASKWVDQDLLETVSAYNCSGSRYAARTRDFDPRSSLPGEIDWLAAHTDGMVLDAGCGAGRDSLRFTQRGRAVIALDASTAMLREVPTHSGILRLMGDIRRLPLAVGGVGAIWCSAVLLHLERSMVRAAFGEFFRVLAAAGLVTVSAKEGEGHDATPMPDSCGYRRHFFYYKLDDLIQLARLEGFEPIRTWAGVEPGADSTPQRWVRAVFRKARA